MRRLRKRSIPYLLTLPNRTCHQFLQFCHKIYYKVIVYLGLQLCTFFGGFGIISNLVINLDSYTDILLYYAGLPCMFVYTRWMLWHVPWRDQLLRSVILTREVATIEGEVKLCCECCAVSSWAIEFCYKNRTMQSPFTYITDAQRGGRR